ncbi:MAG TPA: DUF167 domain-containing protein [Candidatus Limnocylindria bacterium]|nr:DUF167 domain-containing protein [Candidatus Limnocylindria bacterium]
MSGRALVEIHVVPRAGRTAVGGSRDGALVVRVAAAPAEGAANAAVVEALARALGVAPSDVRIERGARGRRKLVSVPEGASGRLAALMK